MNLKIYLVTYDGEERTEELWEEIKEEEKKIIAKELTDKFMKRAGFLPVVPG